MSRKKESEIKILEILEEQGPQSFTELTKKTKKANKTVSAALKNLQKTNLAVKDVDTRKYQITQTGSVVLRSDHLTELMKNKQLFAKYDVIPSKIDYLIAKYGEKILQALYDEGPPLVVSEKDSSIFKDLKDLIKEVEKPVVFGRQKVTSDAILYQLHPPMEGLPQYLPLGVDLIINKEIDPKKLYEMVEKELKVFSRTLTSRIVEGVGKLNGVEREMLRDLSDIKYHDDLVWMRRAYNFNLTLMLHINGKALIEQVNWEEALEKAKEIDKRFLRGVQIAQEKMEKAWKNNKKKVIKDITNRRLEFAAEQRIIWLTHEETQLKSKRMGSSEEEVLDTLIRGIVESPYLKEKVTKQEIRTILNKMLRKEEIRIVPITIYGIETKRTLEVKEQLSKYAQQINT